MIPRSDWVHYNQFMKLAERFPDNDPKLLCTEQDDLEGALERCGADEGTEYIIVSHHGDNAQMDHNVVSERTDERDIVLTAEMIPENVRHVY